MTFLYGEGTRQERTSLKRHLKRCPECRGSVETWKSAKAGLSDWHLESSPGLAARAAAVPVLRWALAALVVLGLGYVLGHAPLSQANTVSVSPAIVSALREQLQTELRSDLESALAGSPETLNTQFRRQLRAELDLWRADSVAAAKAEARDVLVGFANSYAADRQNMLTLFERSEKKEQAEHLSLRRALETVAVVADDKFQRTENQLGRLASYTEARMLPARATQP